MTDIDLSKAEIGTIEASKITAESVTGPEALEALIARLDKAEAAVARVRLRAARWSAFSDGDPHTVTTMSRAGKVFLRTLDGGERD